MMHSFPSLPFPEPRSRRGGVRGSRYLWIQLAALLGATLPVWDDCWAADGSHQPTAFLVEHCYDCHEGQGAEAGLDLSRLSTELHDPAALDAWVEVFDRIASGEMPPPEDVAPIESSRVSDFLRHTEAWLTGHQREQQQSVGRVQGRRLTNLQLERTLQDLLGVDIPLEREMPEEPQTGHYRTLAARQSFSHFQLEQHLKIVDLALDEAFRRAQTPADERLEKMTAKQISRTRTRTREPEYIDGGAVIWSSTLSFYGRLPATTAREDGWYRFRFQVSSLKKPEEHGVWCTIRSGQCVSSAPLMAWVGSFEAHEGPTEVVVEAWLPKGHMLEIRPGDRTLKMARFAGGQSANGEGGRQNVPGIRIDWLDKQRIHRGPDDEQIRQWLFGELPVHPDSIPEKARIDVPDASTAGPELLYAFAERAFRRPVSDAQMQPFIQIFKDSLKGAEGFTGALRAGYRAILCSPRFLYFQESPGQLDDYAIASRLSYLLWNSMPDTTLFRLAEKQRLHRPAVLRKQITRMLDTARGRGFIEDFAYEWLELSEIDFTEPDRRLHPDFDIVVQYAMLEETHRFLQNCLEQNLDVRQLVHCDYTFVNSRLARFYGIEGIQGDQVRRVTLEPKNHRGGLLAQGAILKVSANGTNTSPVLRGVWVSRRILGRTIPPPPDSVPAVEPDIRGAKTVREQLEKHRSQTACAACHTKIDPPGYALENFDAAGKWRETYRRVQGRRVEPGPPIDPSYITADGRPFEDFNTFRALVGADPEPVARNLATQWIAYGTGAEISFADRREIDRIVMQAKRDDFGMRSILNAVVCSPLFLTK